MTHQNKMLQLVIISLPVLTSQVDAGDLWDFELFLVLFCFIFLFLGVGLRWGGGLFMNEVKVWIRSFSTLSRTEPSRKPGTFICTMRALETLCMQSDRNKFFTLIRWWKTTSKIWTETGPTPFPWNPFGVNLLRIFQFTVHKSLNYRLFQVYWGLINPFINFS